MRVAYNLDMREPAGVIMVPIPPDPVILTAQGPIPFTTLAQIAQVQVQNGIQSVDEVRERLWQYPVTWNLPEEDKPA